MNTNEYMDSNTMNSIKNRKALLENEIKKIKAKCAAEYLKLVTTNTFVTTKEKSKYSEFYDELLNRQEELDSINNLLI